MPLALEPNQRLQFILKSDQGKTPPPSFYYHALSARDVGVKQKAINDLPNEATGTKTTDLIKAQLEGVLVDWDNMTGRDGKAIPFNLAELDAILTVNEMWELTFGILAGNHVSDDEKKN